MQISAVKAVLFSMLVFISGGVFFQYISETDEKNDIETASDVAIIEDFQNTSEPALPLCEDCFIKQRELKPVENADNLRESKLAKVTAKNESNSSLEILSKIQNIDNTHDKLESDFIYDVIDFTWSSEKESEIYNALENAQAIEALEKKGIKFDGAECRSSTCKVLLSYTTEEGFDMSKLAMLTRVMDRNSNLIRDMDMSLDKSSDDGMVLLMQERANDNE